MKTPTPFDPENLLRLVQLLLMQLEDTLSAAGDVNEDIHADQLKNQIATLKTKTARVNSALAKHRDAEKRKGELTKDNDRRNSTR